MTRHLQPGTLTRGQFAALRGWLQGLPAAAIAQRWLSTDPDAEWTEVAAQRALREIRQAMAQLALRHGRESLASILASSSRNASKELQAALRELERLGSPAPRPNHAVRLWFAAPLARRLTDAGVATLGELMGLANDRGRWPSPSARRVWRHRHRSASAREAQRTTSARRGSGAVPANPAVRVRAERPAVPWTRFDCCWPGSTRGTRDHGAGPIAPSPGGSRAARAALQPRSIQRPDRSTTNAVRWPPPASLATSRAAQRIGHESMFPVASAASLQVEVERLHDLVERVPRPDLGYDFAIYEVVTPLKRLPSVVRFAASSHDEQAHHRLKV